MGRVIAAAQRRIAVVASIALPALACATPYDPFQIPEEQLRQQIHTVALVPLMVSPDLVDIERVRPQIEPRAIAMLREGGFEVVPPNEWDERWLAVAREAGEIWDPVTGERNDERYASVRLELLRKLRAERSV